MLLLLFSHYVWCNFSLICGKIPIALQKSHDACCIDSVSGALLICFAYQNLEKLVVWEFIVFTNQVNGMLFESCMSL